MKVRVRLFAVLADWAQANEIDVSIPPAGTGEDVLAALVQVVPRVDAVRGSLRLAVNREYVPWSEVIQEGDEVAIIPPVSGGEDDTHGAGEELPFIEITTEPLSADTYQRRVVSPECGAVALFVGVVREFTDDKRTVYLHYEAYEAMAAEEMRRVADDMKQRWPQARIALGHRVGELGIGEASVIVAVATPHRGEAFEAARFGIDTLKERVPIWKKEIWDDGESWVGIHA